MCDRLRSGTVAAQLRWTALVLCHVIGLAGLSEALRLVRLDMPGVVIRGEPLWLNCSFDLESDELYSVKWYKNNREFFRYLPNESPPGQAYKMSGVYVDVSRSSVGSLYMTETDLKTEGHYACEVSADAPSFQTVRSERELKVYGERPQHHHYHHLSVFIAFLLFRFFFYLPLLHCSAAQKGPEIRGTKPHYRIGDVVNVTCYASATKPPAVLMWYINGEQIPPEYERMYPIFRDQDHLYHSSLGLTFTAEPQHFTYGTMKLKCTATVSGAYSLSNEEIVAAVDAKRTGSEDDKPSITGAQASYHVGDLVNVTCSYSRYGRPVDLQWHLNDQEVSNRYLVHYPLRRLESGGQVTSLGLRFTVRPGHFVRDEMRIKCTATLQNAGRGPPPVSSSSASPRDSSHSEKEFMLGSSSHRSSGLHVSEHYGAAALDSNGSSRRMSMAWIIQSCAVTLLGMFAR
ncbi:uncharacterized protein LOC119455991 [Dermacentor silvarum]|uniref:uncharacterized protein LOC119455991 n=1 Tax=Dermacentor silvarum TaxID=543639 RepID=UPI0021014910|nr:uncharacterized protein LOC119455991 [Dermacentor silvarum]